ncbi:hypothetical protein EI555_015930, partial [Monodon monoceros]
GYFQKLKNWSDAELECQSYGNGTHLASILNLKEANTIATYIGGCQRNKPVWICLHDLQKGQQWTWLDGATYIYRTMSGKSVGGNKYYAEMNAMNRLSSQRPGTHWYWCQGQICKSEPGRHPAGEKLITLWQTPQNDK